MGVRSTGVDIKFIIICARCGCQNQLGYNKRNSVQLYFHKGSPNIMDRMVIYCDNCGNKHEIAIAWPLDLNNTENRDVK